MTMRYKSKCFFFTFYTVLKKACQESVLALLNTAYKFILISM